MRKRVNILGLLLLASCALAQMPPLPPTGGGRGDGVPTPPGGGTGGTNDVGSGWSGLSHPTNCPPVPTPWITTPGTVWSPATNPCCIDRHYRQGNELVMVTDAALGHKYVLWVGFPQGDSFAWFPWQTNQTSLAYGQVAFYNQVPGFFKVTRSQPYLP